MSALLAISADEDDDANGAVQAQDGYRRGPQGNIVIDEPIKSVAGQRPPASARPLSR